MIEQDTLAGQRQAISMSERNMAERPFSGTRYTGSSETSRDGFSGGTGTSLNLQPSVVASDSVGAAILQAGARHVAPGLRAEHAQLRKS